MKKLVCVLLVCLLLLPAVPAFAAEKTGRDVPNIHIRGMAGDIVNAEGEEIDNKGFPEGGLAEMVKDCMPAFLNALKEDTEEAWDAYREKLFPAVKGCFGPMWLDNSGEASDGSYQAHSWRLSPVTNNRGTNGYAFDSYPMFVDWRLDPFVNADELNDYIQQIKAVTGSDKVNINARCEGANVLAAYLAKYGYEDLHCIQFYSPTLYGAELADALFSGNIRIDADALLRFQNAKLPIEDELTRELVDALVEFTGDTVLLDLTALSMDVLFIKLYKEVIAPLVRETYGTFPGFWAMVSQKNYPAARRGIFRGCEEQYAGLIEKIEHYDRDVRQHLDELILGAKQAGVPVAVFAYYGDAQVPPLTENANELSDNTVILKNTSLGATTAKYGKTLSASYVKAAVANGTDKYLSPDGMVDASTCLLPDTTWFIWGIPHELFPDYVFDRMAEFYDADGNMTVFSDPSFPQYLIAHTDPNDSDRGTLEPMGKENAPSIDAPQRNIHNVNWKDMIFRVLKAVLNFILHLLKIK